MKRICVLFVALCLLVSAVPLASAEQSNDIALCSDLYINYAKAQLNANGVVEFYLNLCIFADSVFVSSCKLQIKNGSTWQDAGYLPVPTVVQQNTCVFYASANYANQLTSGNSYRVVVTYNIDGYTKSYTSNVITY